jgi:site-specific DNA-methyltransferase (adenine-specific)
MLFDDLEDVFVISKEYHPGEVKNKNKLPNALIEKLVLYSSDIGDTICDLFLGNFTTAYVGLQLSRRVVGFELNSAIFNYHLPLVEKIEFGCKINELKKVEVIVPRRAGQPITDSERWMILWRFDHMRDSGMTKKQALIELEAEFGRGHFGLINIIKERKIPLTLYCLLDVDIETT